MTSAALISLVNAALWAILLYFAIRHRRPWSTLVVIGAWVTNYLLATQHLLAGNLNRTWVTALIVYLLIDRLDKSPTHLKHLATTHVEDARRSMHDAESDRAAWEARAKAYSLLLDKHNIKH